MFVKNEELSGEHGKIFISKEDLTEYILANIPILHSVGLKVTELTKSKIKISAPLYDNRNHYGSAFGGSIATLGIVAGWAVLTYKIKEEKVPAILVIKNSHTEYIKPITENFDAEVIINNADWESLKSKFALNGKAGIEVTAKIISNGIVCAEQKSVYVCIKPKSS